MSLLIPLEQHRPCIFCGRPTAHFRNAGAEGFAHAAPACKPYAALIERVATRLHLRSQLLVLEALGGEHGTN